VNATSDGRSALPKKALLDGARVLLRVLEPHGFHFELRGEGKGAGGNFAWGEFVRADRRLEVHVRYNLGLVVYHSADRSASHESYMRELGVIEQCRYPGFSNNTATEFEGLAHDLVFADDFLSGTADMLQRAAEKEAIETKKRDHLLNRAYVGDIRRIEELKAQFHAKQYENVVAIASQLRYPEALSRSENRMIEIAARRNEKKVVAAGFLTRWFGKIR